MIGAGLGRALDVTYRRRKVTDLLFRSSLGLMALLGVIPLFWVLGYVSMKGIPGLTFSFFTEMPKPVGEAGGGMANALFGTIVMIFLAGGFGVSIGVITGIYLSEYGRGRLGMLVRFSADMLSSVPSIVIGLFVYALLVKPMKGFSALAGGVALGLIMIPTVARSTEELLKLVPIHIREAGLALGLPRWKVILQIVVRGSASALSTGVMLAVARAAGETAPLLFTALNNRHWSHSLVEPISSLPVQIYTYAISPFDSWHTLAWGGALVLVFVVFTINIVTRFVLRSQVGSRE